MWQIVVPRARPPFLHADVLATAGVHVLNLICFIYFFFSNFNFHKHWTRFIFWQIIPIRLLSCMFSVKKHWIFLLLSCFTRAGLNSAPKSLTIDSESISTHRKAVSHCRQLLRNGRLHVKCARSRSFWILPPIVSGQARRSGLAMCSAPYLGRTAQRRI